MGLFGKKNNGGIMDVIRCDEPSYLIWKWHPVGSQPGESKKENSIRFGSSLRVKDGEVAVFVYNQKNGIYQDFIEGPFDEILKTENLPIISKLVGLAYHGDTPFQAEVYFINMARINQVKFGVPYFDIFDPRFPDFGVPVSVRGTVSFSIANYREFIKIHKLNSFSLTDFERQIRDVVIRYTKDLVTNSPSENNIPLVQIETQIGFINDALEMYLKKRLEEDFGVCVSGVDLSAIELDKSSEGYKQLSAVTKDYELSTTMARKEAEVKNIHEMQRIDAEDYAESLRIQREEIQYGLHKQTQTNNYAVFQTETQAQVGIAGANALGQMAQNGATEVNVGGNGMNMAGMMTGMAMGGVVAQNMAGMMNNIMGSIQQPTVDSMSPPPIPQIVYYVAVNGQQTGPFDINTLTGMAQNGALNQESLVWKPGLPSWMKASTVDGIKELFNS